MTLFAVPLKENGKQQKTDGMFSTAILSPILSLNQLFLTNASDFVAEAGIEPAISRL